MKKFLLVLGFLAVSTLPALACLSSPFTAKYDNQDLARIRGNKILDAGWIEYSRGEDQDHNITRFSKTGAPAALWLFEAKEQNKQPGIVWAVRYDHGIIEGFSAFYKIRTNVRSIGRGEGNVTPVVGDGRRFKVGCGN